MGKKRSSPKPPKKSVMTPARRAEEEDFERRMADHAAAQRSAKEFAKAEKARVAKVKKTLKEPFARKTPRFKIARAFRAGHGSLS